MLSLDRRYTKTESEIFREKRRYGPTIRLIRQFLICVPAKIRELQTRIVFGLPPMPEAWQRRFEILME